MKPTPSTVVCAGVLAWLCALPASAAAILYANEAAFVTAAGATLHSLPGSTTPAFSITTTDGLLTLTTTGISGTLHSNWEVTSGVSRFSGPDLAISGVESFDGVVSLGADRFAFGFGIFEPTNGDLTGCNTTCAESTFTISLYNNGSLVGSPFTLSPANDTAVFWGVHTDFAFDAVRVRETTGTNDNEIFGTFYTGRTPIPEPGTLLLLASGLAIAGARQHRRRA